MLRCTMMRRVVVQRWPAVPTAPNKIARVARSRSASSATMMALLPPSSRIDRPKRRATASATRWPTCVEPVNEINGRRRSFKQQIAHSDPRPTMRLKTPARP